MSFTVAAALRSLDHLVKAIGDQRASGPVGWGGVQGTLDDLDREAESLNLPFGLIRQKTTSLRHHLGTLLGVVASDDHPQQQHVVWALGDLDALRSDHCFGPVLPNNAEVNRGFGLFTLDYKIFLGDRITTIRTELTNGNGHTMRSYIMEPDKPEVSRYWVVIYKQPHNSEMFEVCREDLEYLRNQGIHKEFT